MVLEKVGEAREKVVDFVFKVLGFGTDVFEPIGDFVNEGIDFFQDEVEGTLRVLKPEHNSTGGIPVGVLSVLPDVLPALIHL